MAGVAYILWQVHKESNGFLSGMLIIVVLFCSPIVLTQSAGNIDQTLGILLGSFFVFAIIALFVRSVSTNDQEQKKALDESMQIWREVYSLPLPDEETIRAYRLANKIPLYPEDCKVYRDAAIEKWRINEYNKRFKEKHKFVFYI